jgi:uncharacterized protein (DUF433 family)
MFGFDRITFDPKIMAGQACIRGMRVPVSLITKFIFEGFREDLLQALNGQTIRLLHQSGWRDS